MAYRFYPEGVPNVLAGLFMAALAVWILRLNPRERFHQATALLLLLRGAANVFGGLLHPDSYAQLVSPYDPIFLPLIAAEICLPPAVVYFAMAFHHHRRATDPPAWMGWVLAAATVAAVTLVLSDPAFFHLRPDTDRIVYLAFGLKWLAYAGAATWILVQAVRAPTENQAWPLVLVGLALGLNAAFQGGIAQARLIQAGFDSARPFNSSAAVLEAVGGLLLLWVMVALVRAARPHKGAAAALVVAFATGFVSIGLNVALGPAGRGGYIQFMDGLWTLAMPLLLGHAVVRQTMFRAGARARTTMHGTTLAAVGLAVFFIVTQLVQNFFTERYHWAFGGIATGLLLFALNPIQRVAERITEGPRGPGPGRELPPQERLEIYREQVQLAWRDGSLSREERRMLDGLRTRLGISEVDAARAEAEAAAA